MAGVISNSVLGVSRGWFCGGVLGGEQALEGAVVADVVGDAVVPAVPDHIQPRTGEDPDRVRVVLSTGDRGVVDVGGPGAGVAGAVGEVADRAAQLLADGPAEGDGFVLAGLAGGRRGAGQADQCLGVGEAGPAVADLGQQPGGADGARAGSEVKTCPSACSASWAAIWASSALIWVFKLASTAASARDTWALAAPASPLTPRGAHLSRS